MVCNMRHSILWGGLGALALFFAYAALMLVSPSAWTSPDEAAVAYVAEHGLMTLAPFGKALGGLVSPRSLMVVDGSYVPSSWVGLAFALRTLVVLGIPISWSVLLVPLVAVLGVISWKSIAARVSGREDVGWIAALLLAVHPGWWHYALRGLHPNVPFVSLLLCGVWSWMKAFETRRPWMLAGTSGVLFGLAVFVRANEAVWLVPLLAVFLVFAWARASRPVRHTMRIPIAAAVAGFLLPIILMGAVHEYIYGSPFSVGYNRASDPIPGLEVNVLGDNASLFSSVVRTLFPFGVHELNTLRNVWSFHAAFFWPWTILFFFGVGWVFFERRSTTKPLILILYTGAMIALYLLIEYGSWQFRDNPDPRAITIGTSYIRYWLPISVWMTLFAAYGVVRAVKEFSMRTRRYIYAFGGTALVMLSTSMVVFSPQEGLVPLLATVEVDQAHRSWVMSQTNERDLLIVDRSDKYLFPERSVIVPLRSEQTYASMRLAYDAVQAQGGRLLYYGLTLPPQDVEHLNTVRLASHGLQIQDLSTWGDMTLYIVSE